MRGIAAYHPSVIGFCHDHGLDLQFGYHELDRITQQLERLSGHVDTLSVDPPRVKVTTELDDDELWLVFDENLHVLEIGP